MSKSLLITIIPAVEQHSRCTMRGATLYLARVRRMVLDDILEDCLFVCIEDFEGVIEAAWGWGW